MVFLNSVLIFSKAPIKGFVKTRLQKDTGLDESDVLFLYESFLKDVFQSVLLSRAERIYVGFHPEGNEDLIASSLSCEDESKIRSDRIVFFPQVGSDFDERFSYSVKRVLNDSERVVVIGGDSPHIQPGTINRALELLKTGKCMVIGPASEGGVYLVGIERPMDFTGIFKAGVESENLALLAVKNGFSLHLLERLTDIDVAIDLIDFICSIKAMETASKSNNFKLPVHSINAIKKLGITINNGSGGERGKRIIRDLTGGF